MTQPFLLADTTWVEIRDGNPSGMALFRRHYSCLNLAPKVYQFIGPGEKMALITPDASALFVWRKFINDAGERGVNCAVFRNEGEARASDLIREADRIAWERWPGDRLYTYVDPTKTRRSRQPGRCFLKAGWRYVVRNGRRYITPRGLLLLEILP